MFFIFILLLWFDLIINAQDKSHLLIGVSRSFIFILFEELIELLFRFLNSLFSVFAMIFVELQFMSSDQKFFAHFGNFLLFWVVHLRSHFLRIFFDILIDLLVVGDLIFVCYLSLGINVFIILFFILITLNWLILILMLLSVFLLFINILLLTALSLIIIGRFMFDIMDINILLQFLLTGLFFDLGEDINCVQLNILTRRTSLQCYFVVLARP